MLATLTRHLGGDLALAEDAVQDAFVAAAADWPRRGVPDRPGAWLTVDRAAQGDRPPAPRAGARRPAARPRWLDAAMADDDAIDEPTTSALDDDRLRLIFTCCHPALALEARIALTLRSVGGLTAPELARAFLVTESAMAAAARARASARSRAARIPYRVPPDDLLPERLGGVLRVVYLIFNEGHTATAGERAGARRALRRGDPARPACSRALMPDDAETLGLLALLLLDRRAARRARRTPTARSSRSSDQDRSRWDARADRRGPRRRSTARCGCGGRGRTSCRRRSPRVHAEAPSFEDDRLARRSPRSTASARATTRRRSSRSTARSRSRSPTGRAAGLRAARRR